MMDLARLGQRLAHMLMPGKVTLVDDSGPTQLAQADFGPYGSGELRRVFDKIPVAGWFGFAANPPVGSALLAAFLRGEQSSGMVIGTNHQPSRPTGLQPGDSVHYDANGQFLRFTADGAILSAGGCTITMSGGVMTLKADQIVTDGLTRLNNGVAAVATRGSSTTRGDTIADGAADVYA